MRNSTKNELGNVTEWSLFDLSNDRGQLENIAGSCPEVLQTLREEFKKAVGDHYDPSLEEEKLQ